VEAVSNAKDLHKRWMKAREYRKAHEALAAEFELACALIQARAQAGLAQHELARHMDTTQSVIADLESGRARPSTETLDRLAVATGTRLRIGFERR
jgi:ribosome-binding protein aMBF1 (putative translation factor)